MLLIGSSTNPTIFCFFLQGVSGYLSLSTNRLIIRNFGFVDVVGRHIVALYGLTYDNDGIHYSDCVLFVVRCDSQMFVGDSNFVD